ncbi:NTP transferase domain-containing protein [Polynucleobacter paneuropaeus]|nr:NTP transferase domain-containing protein [Polynucleobacter paneuropaeus]
MLPVAILAGGLATRLRPITQTIPKALIEVAGKPFVAHQLQYLRQQGITSVILCIGYLGGMIQDFVGNGSHWDLDVSYSLDGPVLLGTGGALKQALPMLGENFFVLYGDSFLPINYEKVQKAFIDSAQLSLMTVLKNENQWDRSNVQFEFGKLIEYNKEVISPKMRYIDYGLGVLQASVLDSYPDAEPLDISKVYNELSIRRQLYGYEVFDRFYEIGSIQGIADTQTYLLQKTAKDIS